MRNYILYNKIISANGGSFKMIKQLIKEEIINTQGVIKHDWLNEKVLNEIKLTTSLYDHIEVVNKSYDKENITRSVLENVEGMGYGWKGVNYEEKDWYKMMCKMVEQECNSCKNSLNYTYFILSEDCNVKSYNLISVFDDETRKDVIISFSNTEL